MVEVIAKINERASDIIIKEISTMSEFSHANGYELRSKDLGNRGVIIEIGNKYEEGRAIILPPKKAKEYGKWLLRTIGEKKREFPKELAGILEKLIEEKNTEQKLKKSEKSKIKSAIRILKKSRSQN